MRVALVVWDLGRSGGMDAIRGHAERLGARGWQVELVGAGPAASTVGWVGSSSPWDVVLATWWETVPAALALGARVHALLLQGLEERVYAPEEVFHARTAAAVLDLGLPVLAVSSWLAGEAAARRPDARVSAVPVGIDKTRWAEAPLEAVPPAPLRVLVEGQPSVRLKRVREALAAVRAMREEASSTLVCLGDPGSVDADRVERDVPADDMPALVAQHDVLLKLSDAEGLGLPALEALHRGRPVVLTPYGGASDYLRPGENGVEVPFGDTAAAARALDALAADRGELARLAAGAAPSVAGWPSPEESTDRLAAALEELVADPPSPDLPARRLFRALWDFRAGVEEHGATLVARRAAEEEAARLQRDRDAILASRAHRALMRLGLGVRKSA